MDFWREMARNKIDEAIRSGEWDDLPGKGQPLHLEDDSDVPEHLRLANKVLRDANVTPPWIDEHCANSKNIACKYLPCASAPLPKRAIFAAATRKLRPCCSNGKDAMQNLQQAGDAPLKSKRRVVRSDLRCFSVRDELQVFARSFRLDAVEVKAAIQFPHVKKYFLRDDR